MYTKLDIKTYPYPKLNPLKNKISSNLFTLGDKVVLFNDPYEGIVIEEDVKYFKKLIKTFQKTNFSNKSYGFFPLESDFRVIKNEIYNIILYITKSCNSNCRICFEKNSSLSKLKYNMSKTDIKNLLSKIGKNKNIILFGGEPTMRKDIFQIIRLIKESKNKPLIYTNGLKLANSSYVKRLKDNGVKSVILSFNGFREEIYEKLQGNKNYFYLKLKALKNLEKNNIDVYFSTIIAYGINDDQIQPLLNFAIKNNHFIRGINFLLATPFGKFDINTKIITPSFITRKLEEITNHQFKIDYFLEFRKFIKNVDVFAKKIRINVEIGSNTPVIFKVKNNNINELIPLKNLREINRLLEEERPLSVLKIILKHPSYIKDAIRILSHDINKFLEISLGFVNLPITHLPIKFNTVGISKLRDKIIVMGNTQ
jgi:uncharacterized radical SAM superfamily Fe-S cluster-containing enzyme